MKVFRKIELKRLYKPPHNSSGEDNGQVTIIGGSKLFHGAPILSLKSASRVVDMVFFTSPEPGIGEVVNHIKSQLSSFIWVPWEEIEAYVAKSDAILIGPGLMRYQSESKALNKELTKETFDEAGKETCRITQRLLTKFSDKKWVIDAGSLQVMKPEWIPKGAILTPNKKEYEILFGKTKVQNAAKEYDCIIVLKGEKTLVCSPDECIEVRGGNAGLTKGGTGDTLAGFTVALLAKNDPLLAAASASYILKATADKLHEKVGTNYNADDLADYVPTILKSLSN